MCVLPAAFCYLRGPSTRALFSSSIRQEDLSLNWGWTWGGFPQRPRGLPLCSSFLAFFALDTQISFLSVCPHLCPLRCITQTLPPSFAATLAATPFLIFRTSSDESKIKFILTEAVFYVCKSDSGCISDVACLPQHSVLSCSLGGAGGVVSLLPVDAFMTWRPRPRSVSASCWPPSWIGLFASFFASGIAGVCRGSLPSPQCLEDKPEKTRRNTSRGSRGGTSQ